MLQKCDLNNEDTDIKYVYKELEENCSEVKKKSTSYNIVLHKYVTIKYIYITKLITWYKYVFDYYIYILKTFFICSSWSQKLFV